VLLLLVRHNSICKDGACVINSSTTTNHTPTPEPTTVTTTTAPTTEPTNTESEITQPIIENNVPVCTSGCLFVKSCLPYGYRTAISYCNIDNTLTKQISEGSCENNFECTSNLCVDGQCTTPGIFLQIINWFKALFGVK
jgi:hypothetical protein